MRLQFKPFEDKLHGRNFDDLTEAEIKEIADDMEIDKAAVEIYFRRGNEGNPEFDGFVVKQDGDAVYYESKSGSIDLEDDIEKKFAFMKGYAKLTRKFDDVDDIDETEMVLIHRNPEDASRVDDEALKFLRDRADGDVVRESWDEIE